jgi:hypothetical protein
MGIGASTLEHITECTGRWHVSGYRDTIACGGCGARYPYSDERRFAVVYEHVMGMKLRELTAAGQELLRRQRESGSRDGGT